MCFVLSLQFLCLPDYVALILLLAGAPASLWTHNFFLARFHHNLMYLHRSSIFRIIKYISHDTLPDFSCA
jgi:hypothetical protein